MGKKHKKKKSKASGPPTDDGELQAQPDREVDASADEPGVAINNLRDADRKTD